MFDASLGTQTCPGRQYLRRLFERSQLTIQISFKMLERVDAIVLFESHNEARFLVLIHEPLHQDLFVRFSGSDLQPFQLQKLVEYAPLQMIPEINIGQ